jgi:hypothetical protein
MRLVKELVALSGGGSPVRRIQKIKVEMDRGRALISAALPFIQKV